MRDYYSVLGVEKTASTEDVKIAYKKLAKKWHPDKNPDNQEEAERKFKEISEAYQTLVDYSKRQEYDNKGFGERRKGSGFHKNSRSNSSQDFSDNFTQSSKSTGPEYKRSKFRQSRRNTEPRFSSNDFHHSSFLFKDPNDVFRDFFGGQDPFKDFNRNPIKDFFEPSYDNASVHFGLTRSQRMFEKSIPNLLRFSSFHGMPESNYGCASIFDEIDEVEKMFRRFDFSGHDKSFFPSATRKAPRSQSTHTSGQARSNPKSSAFNQSYRNKKY